MKNAKAVSTIAIESTIHRELKEYSHKTGIKIGYVAEEAIREWLNKPEQLRRAQRKH